MEAFAAPVPTGENASAARFARSAELFDGASARRAASVAVPAALGRSSAVALAGGGAGRGLALLVKGGDWTGNALGIFMPLPEIYEVLRRGGGRETPISRSLIVSLASAALFVNAAEAHRAFWGVQNAFQVLAMAAVPALNAWLSRRGGLSKKKAVVATAASFAGLLAASLALYYGLGPSVPGWLSALPVPTETLTAVIQYGAGALFLSVFLPEIRALWTKRLPKSFSPGFSLTFFISSLAMIAWALPLALSFPARSPSWWKWMGYSGQNALYAVVSFISYRMARRQRLGLLPEGRP